MLTITQGGQGQGSGERVEINTTWQKTDCDRREVQLPQLHPGLVPHEPRRGLLSVDEGNGAKHLPLHPHEHVTAREVCPLIPVLARNP